MYSSVLLSFDLADEAISSPLQRFHVAWLVRRIPQRIPQPFNRCVDAVIELYDGVVRPEFLANLLAQHHLAGMRHEHQQDSEGLFLEPDLDAVVAQLSGANV